MKFFVQLIQKYRKAINPPYNRRGLISILGTIILLIAIPTIALSVEKLREFNSKAAAVYGVEIGVAVNTQNISDPTEPKQLTYVYHYVNWDSYGIGPTYAAAFIKGAYNNNFKPVLVFYTSYDDVTKIDFNAWDQIMNVIRTDGRDVWVVVEPDMVGYLRQDNACSTTLKQYEDRFLQTKAPTAHLGYHMSPWNVPYVGAQADADAQKTCWLASGGDRMEDIYVDVLDRDQETKGEYPWSAAKLTQTEDWWKALEVDTGRKIGVWQIPMGNSTCNNGARSNFVETWLTATKLNVLSPYVNRLLFGGGADGQSANLPSEGVYDCGFFNQRVADLFSTSDTRPPTVSITAPTSGQTVSGTVTVIASASDNVGVVKVEFYVDGSLKSTITDNPVQYTYSWNTASYSNGSYTLIVKAYDSAGNVGVSPSVLVTVNNTATKVGDLNTDGKVDILDLSILLTRWGSTDTTADLNKSGKVDILDLSILLSKWGS